MKNIAVEKILKNNSSLRSNIKMFHCNTLLRMKSNTISYMYIYIYYIRNKVLYFSSRGNVSANNGMYLIQQYFQ